MNFYSERERFLGLTDILETARIHLGSLVLVCCTLSWAFGYVSGYGFLADTAVFDGFREGLYEIERLLNDGGVEPFLSEPLLIVHLIRYGVAKPFLILQENFGPVGPLIPILALMIPLVLAGCSPRQHHYQWLCRLLILFAPLFVSGRTILVAIGAGYLCLGALRKAHPVICFTLGISLATLSSAAVFVGIAILTLGAGMPRSRPELAIRAAAVAVLAVILLPSYLHKFEGFRQQKVGYQQSESFHADSVGRSLDPDEILIAVVARSTVVQSLQGNNISRFVVYCMFASGVLLSVASDLHRRKLHVLTPTVLLVSCTFFAEGLGVWTLLFPLAWRFTSSRAAWSATYEAPENHALILQTSCEDARAG